MKTKATKSNVRKSKGVSVSRDTLAETARYVVEEFAVHALPYDWLEIGDRLDAYPNSLFVDEDGDSHISGVDLRNCPDYLEFLAIEWKFALAEKYFDDIQWHCWTLGQHAAFRFTESRKNKKLVLSKRSKLEKLLKDAKSCEAVDVPFSTQIAIVLTVNRAKNSKSSSSEDLSLRFWEHLVPLSKSLLKMPEDQLLSLLIYERSRKLLTPSFAEGFIEGCLKNSGADTR